MLPCSCRGRLVRRAQALGGQRGGAVSGRCRPSPALTSPSFPHGGASTQPCPRLCRARPETRVRAHSPQIQLSKGYHGHKHSVRYQKVINKQQGFLGTAAKPVRVCGDRRRDQAGGDRLLIGEGPAPCAWGPAASLQY